MHGRNSETALGHSASEQGRIHTKNKQTGVKQEVGRDMRSLGTLGQGGQGPGGE